MKSLKRFRRWMVDRAIRQAANRSVFSRWRVSPLKEQTMNEPRLPTHVIEKFERRWASRLAREAEAWRYKRPGRSSPRQVVDREGRTVPVTSRHRTLTATHIA